MSGQILKGGGGKANFNSKKFKNAFSFKQQDQKKRLQSHQEEESTTNSSVAKKKKRYRKAASPADDSTVCSDDKESILIFPTVQRLTASSPPLTIGQQKCDNGFFGIERSLSLRRSSSKGISSSARSAPPSMQTNRSPYQSRKEKKNLPETLKSCRRSASSSSGRIVNDKYTMNESASAWERRLVSTSGSRVNSSRTPSKSFGGYSMINEDEVFAIRQTKSDSSNGSFLPVEVTPANKFVPIGLEDDDVCDDVPFNEEDYDICILPISEDEEADKSAAKTQVVKTKNKKKATPPSASENTAVKSKAQDLDKYQHEQDRYSLPPSPVSTGDTDWTSLESKDTEEETNCYGFNLGGAAEHELSPICKGSDKYCVAASEYYPNDNEWVAYARQEIMRLSSLFTSDCSS